MSKTPHIINLDTASPDNLGFADIETSGQKFVRIGYTDSGCPGAFTSATPAIKLVKVSEKNQTITATFSVGSNRFATNIKTVVDDKIESFIDQNSKKLRTKSMYYLPFVYKRKDGKKYLKLDVTSAVIFNEKGELDNDVELKNCDGKFFRSYFVIDGISRSEHGYHVHAFAPQLKIVQETYVDSRPDSECGYETTTAGSVKSHTKLETADEPVF